MKIMYIFLENGNEAFLNIDKIVYFEEIDKETTRVHLITGTYLDTKKPFDDFTNYFNNIDEFS